jgi:murein DD-endopeptidase MepM/ murein hydrolase activator NlpD
LSGPDRTLAAAIALGAVFTVLFVGRLRAPLPGAAPGSSQAPQAAEAPRIAGPPPAPPDALPGTAAGRRAGEGIEMRGTLGTRRLSMPILGLVPGALQDTFAQGRGGGRRHEAVDILAPRGTPVLAVDDGTVAKLFVSVPGGITVYHFDPTSTYCYYYAHLERWAEGLHEGQTLARGDLVGYVGTSGNAPKETPHLHLAITRLGPEKHWWQGTPIDPYPILVASS